MIPINYMSWKSALNNRWNEGVGPQQPVELVRVDRREVLLGPQARDVD